MDLKKVAIACQGGASHCAFTAGVLAGLLRRVTIEGSRIVLDGKWEIVALSGTSGGAISAYLAWIDLLRLRKEGKLPPQLAVEKFWEANEASWWDPSFFNLWTNLALVGCASMEGSLLPKVRWPSTCPPAWFSQDVQNSVGARVMEAAGDVGFLHGADMGSLDREHAKKLGAGSDHSPRILIGAAEVNRSEFRPFIGTPKHPPTIEQVVASTALPEMFPAVPISRIREAHAPGTGGHRGIRYYWDGLLSQNPPLTDLTGPRNPDARPDEIWIVRIDPARRTGPMGALDDAAPRLASEIEDRRNEMEGNLSLELEKRAIRKINRMLREGDITRAAASKKYKPIALWGIALEGPADVPEDKEHRDGRWRQVNLRTERRYPAPLDYASKLLRSASFLRELRRVGEDALQEFLEHRAHLRDAGSRTRSPQRPSHGAGRRTRQPAGQTMQAPGHVGSRPMRAGRSKQAMAKTRKREAAH